jgi:hypothetical protein
LPTNRLLFTNPQRVRRYTVQGQGQFDVLPAAWFPVTTGFITNNGIIELTDIVSSLQCANLGRPRTAPLTIASGAEHSQALAGAGGIRSLGVELN